MSKFPSHSPGGKPRGFDVVCIGYADLDLILDLASPAHWGDKLTARFAGEAAGGCMGNTACYVAGLGGHAAWMGNLGGDAGGRFLREELAACGVDVQRVRFLPGERTSFTVIVRHPGGERTIFVVPLLPERLDLTPEDEAYLAGTRFVYLSPHDLELATTLAERAGRLGFGLALEVEATVGRSLSDLADLLRSCDVVVGNRRGLATLLDLDASTPAEALGRGCRRLLDLGPRLIACTLGADGALLVSRETGVWLPGLAVPVVDTTGAGDCFAAALLYELGRGVVDVVEAGLFANAAAALSVGGAGPRGLRPTHGEVRRLLEQHRAEIGSKIRQV